MRNHLFKRITAMALAGFMALSLHSPVLADDFFQEDVPEEEIVVELDESGMGGSEVDISLDASETVDLTEETEENTDFFTDDTVDLTEETIDLTEESDGTERIEGDLVSDNIDGETNALGEEPVETEFVEEVETDEAVDLTEEAVDLTTTGGMGGIQAKAGGVATLVTGMTFSERLKKLAGNASANMQSADSAITSIIRTNEPFTAEGNGIISDSASAFPIYARFDGGTIYIYTDAEIIATPANLENMFDNMTALASTNLFESGIDTSAAQKTNYAFRNCSSLGSLDFSSVNFGNVVDMKDMFLRTGLSEIVFGSGFRFASATGLNKDVNWAAPNGNIYNTYMLETTSSLPGSVTATGDAPNQTYEIDNLYYGSTNVLAGNNMMRLEDGSKSTAYCINKNRGEVYGYYVKVVATDDSGDVNPEYMDAGSSYSGGAPIGDNLAEALAVMLYYGEQEIDEAETSSAKMGLRNDLQDAIWHFTDEYNGVEGYEKWANMSFDEMPGSSDCTLYVYKNLSGRQNAISVDCVIKPDSPEPGPDPVMVAIPFEKRTTDGRILPGANLSLYKADANREPTGNAFGSWVSSAGGDILQVVSGMDYVIVETDAPSGYQPAANIFIGVALDGTVTCDAVSDGKIIMVDEPIPVTGKVRISKQDIAGKEIPGAVLKVYETANPSNVIDSWTSAEDTTHEIESVPAGEYTLEETTAPGGYIKAESITFTVDSSGNVVCDNLDSDGRIVMTDEATPVTAKVRISKQDIAGKEIPGAVLKVYETANPENIIDSWTSAEDTTHEIESVPAGEYTLEETTAPGGYVKAESITFTVDSDGNVVCDNLDSDGRIVMTDEATPVTAKARISKQDVAGKEIPGAVLKVYETANPENVIDSWTSVKDTTHEIESVPEGEYTLEETTAPNGYIRAESITFSVDSDGKVTCGSTDSDGRIVMTDEIITVPISKQDIAGAEIEGAELKIYNSNKEVVEEWTSVAGNTHIVEGLAAGEYTLVETTAPDGFQKAESITFTVAADGTVTAGGKETEKIVMTDAPSEVSISKQDIAGKEIEGAVLIIKDKNGVEKTRWTSSAGKTHVVYGLTAGEYTLIEETAPSGYVKAESISFKLNRDGTVECNSLDDKGNIVMTDEYLSKTIVISKQDTASKELPGARLIVKNDKGEEIKSWISGEKPTEIKGLGVGTYTLTEITAPDGYLKAETIEFTVRADGAVTSKNMKNGQIVMTDKPTEVVISKRDVAGSEIEGAHISIYDIFDEEVASWTSSASESHTVKGLKAGTYRLVETQAPEGYVIAEEITFTLDEEGNVTSKNLENGKIVMVDGYAPKKVVISKQDIAGKEIAGAELKVTNSKDEEIDKWTSVEGQSHPIEDLEEGTYTLTEITAPKGYEIAESISFNIKKDGTVDTDALIGSKIVMKDKYIERSVKIRKVDESSKYLAGAELSVTNAAGKEMAVWTSKDGEDYEVKGLIPGSYVIVEKKAPAGYTIAKPIKFDIAIDGKVTCSAMNADGVIVVTNAAREYPVKIRKADIAGDEIPGAKLTITDASGKEVKSWVSEADKIRTVTLLPGSYTLTEVTAPDGYERAESIAFTVDKDGKVTPDKLDESGNILMTDAYSTSSVAIKKTDINGTMIAGAKMQIVHVEGGKETVDAEWTSAAGESYIAKNLKPGTYMLKEAEAPAGYIKAENITFEVAADGTVKVGSETVTAVTMVDKFDTRDVVISKQNVAGEEIPGAKIVITDKDKKTVDSWTSEAGKSHTFKAYPGTYTLTETQAPNGYEVAESIDFTVGADGKITVGGSNVSKVVMVDKYSPVPVIFRKVQIVDGKEQLLAGASMQVYHAFNGTKVVDAAWNTTANEKAVNLNPGTYVYNELSAPAGFDLAQDITFIVSADRTISIIKKVKDANGNTVQRAYKQENLTITMVDSVQDNKFDVLIEKLDRSGARLGGAILDVSRKDGENMVLLDSWTTKADADQVMRLSAGSYILHETTPPAGFVRAADIAFTVGEKGEIKVSDQVLSKISMYDDMTKVSITKQDESGKGLAGATLQILDANKQVVDSWTSTTGTRTFTGVLAAGQTYTLHESAAPNGYAIAADITFTVRDDGQEQVIVMKDSKGENKNSTPENNGTTPNSTTPNGTTPANNSNNAQTPGTTGNLRVNKVVAGEGADQNKKFGFIVTLTQNGKPLEGTYVMNLMGTEGRITFNAAGQAGFELSHGQSMVIYNIPVNVNYTVQELDYTAEGYTASVSGNGDGKGVSSGDNVVTFTNTFGVQTQANGNAATTAANQPSYTSTISRATGDNSHMMIWIMGIAAAALAAGFIARKRFATR